MALAISTQVVFEVVGGEAVLLNLDNGTYFQLTGVGSRVWQLLEQGASGEAEVRDRLLEEYDVAPERLDADLDVLWRDLEQAGLISRSARGDGAG